MLSEEKFNQVWFNIYGLVNIKVFFKKNKTVYAFESALKMKSAVKL